MVAAQQREALAKRGLQGLDRPQHFPGIRAAVEQVAQQDQPVRVGIGPELVEQARERRVAAVDVPDDQSFHKWPSLVFSSARSPATPASTRSGPDKSNLL